METIRQVAQFKLNYCPLQNMYNISNEILIDYTKDKGVSFWLNENDKEIIMLANDNKFIDICKRQAGNDIYSLEVLRGLWDEVKKLPTNEKNELKENYSNHFRNFYKGENKKVVIDFIKDHFKIKNKFK